MCSLFQLIKTHIAPACEQHAHKVAVAGGSVPPSPRNTACTRTLVSLLTNELANLKRILAKKKW